MVVADILAELESFTEDISQGKIKNIILGEHPSGLLGDGREPHDIDEWEPGDSIKDIDWRSTMLTLPDTIQKINRVEAKDLPIVFALDASPSMLVRFRADTSKFDVMLRMMMVLAFSSINNHDPVGVATFATPNIFFSPPRYGKKNLFQAVERLLEEAEQFYQVFQNKSHKNIQVQDVEECLWEILFRVRQQAIVLVVSDFMDVLYGRTDIDEELLSALVARHKDNVVFLILDDEDELSWTGGLGTVMTRNIETGRQKEVKASHAALIRAEHTEKQLAFQKYLESRGIDSLALSSNNWFDKLADFAAGRH